MLLQIQLYFILIDLGFGDAELSYFYRRYEKYFNFIFSLYKGFGKLNFILIFF